MLRYKLYKLTRNPIDNSYDFNHNVILFIDNKGTGSVIYSDMGNFPIGSLLYCPADDMGNLRNKSNWYSEINEVTLIPTSSSVKFRKNSEGEILIDTGSKIVLIGKYKHGSYNGELTDSWS